MNLSLFGYGLTTQAIAKHEQNKYTNITFYDDNVNKHFTDEHGFKVKNSSEFVAKYSSLEIPSPGINPKHLLIQAAKNLQSEYDYFSNIMPFSIWISGTNGKTTTTQMTAHLLNDKDSSIGGNIGIPLANLDINKSIWILETSSYTFHYTHKAKPNIYLLLPISDDHINWHGSFEAYENAKLKPLKNMLEGEMAILPSEYRNVPTNAFCIYYDNANDLAHYFNFEIEKINYKGGFLLDALLAMAVDKILFDRVDYQKINTFTLDAHRQEKIFDRHNRIWINDSKATNLDATIAAIEAYNDQKIHLIIGGEDKGADLEVLFNEFKKINIHLYLIGANQEKLTALSKKFKINYTNTSTLENSVNKIDTNLSQNDIALLSPAAASFDQFKNYQDRGNQFKKLVTKI